MVDPGTAELFEGHVGSTFLVEHHGRPPVEVELAEVRRGAEQPEGPRRHPFVLTFTAPPGSALPQATYPLRHAVLGALEIFLVPVGLDTDGGLRLEAVFN